MNILFISLGCDKNLVDTEVMLGMLASRGYQMVEEETQADVIVINTCCFVHDAKEESIQNILEMAEYCFVLLHLLFACSLVQLRIAKVNLVTGTQDSSTFGRGIFHQCLWMKIHGGYILVPF